MHILSMLVLINISYIQMLKIIGNRVVMF